MTGKSAVYTDTEIDGYTDDYVTFVMEQLESLTAPLVFVEQKVDCSRYIPECVGRFFGLRVCFSKPSALNMNSTTVTLTRWSA